MGRKGERKGKLKRVRERERESERETKAGRIDIEVWNKVSPKVMSCWSKKVCFSLM